MAQRPAMLWAFIAIFTLSGFSGLIYESIWSHYLKLFLGHSSYAQVLVLSIFMGGMALGAALTARYSYKLTNLILGYGVCEAIIGLFGIGFHTGFVTLESLAFAHIFPALEQAYLVHSVKWLLGSLLILPQSILLGATFPLFTAGILRRFPAHSGKTLATMYFVNSLGAAIGILCNAFILIPAVGLPGAVLTAGLINIFLALVIYMLTKGDSFPQAKPKNPSQLTNNKTTRYLFVIAALTGLASFMYEIGWIRMLTMVLGGSTHAFEIMLSAFILGLAIGGFLIRQYIDKISNPLLVLALIQIVMGVLAALTLPVYNWVYGLMGFVIDALDTTDGGYQLYSVFSYAIALIVMLPVTICAGTTLPLVTYILLKQQSGEQSIGKVYAFNTLGSIVGIGIAIQLVMPQFGLKWVLLSGALVDIGLGLFIIWRTQNLLKHKGMACALASCAMLMLLLVTNTQLDASKMASGVFRYGLAHQHQGEVIFHYDGKTSTVAVKQQDNRRSLLNNGKPDASLALKSADNSQRQKTNDENTMVLLGTLPYVYHPQAKTIANIGLGSGLTTHTLLHAPGLLQLDTVEIEQGVVQAARYFQPNINNVFEDKRSHIHLEDAKTYFAATGNQYDVIVSEPPNPWVSGVAGLFSIEFYRDIQRYLTQEGILVQWMHLYEISPELVATVYQALSSNFSYIHFYYLSTGDIALVASNRELQPDYAYPLSIPGLKQELAQVNITQANDLAFRKLADNAKLRLLFSFLQQNANSDFFPILDLGAAKTRFKKASATSLYQLHQSRALDLLSGEKVTIYPQVTEDPATPFTKDNNQINAFYRHYQSLLAGEKAPLMSNKPQWQNAVALKQVFDACQQQLSDGERDNITRTFMQLSRWFYAYLPWEQQQQIYAQAQNCKDNFSGIGNNWVKAHLAWFRQDWQAIFEHTQPLLETAKSLNSPSSNQFLLMNLTSRLVLRQYQGVDVIAPKISSPALKDLELKALLHLVQQQALYNGS